MHIPETKAANNTAGRIRDKEQIRKIVSLRDGGGQNRAKIRTSISLLLRYVHDSEEVMSAK